MFRPIDLSLGQGAAWIIINLAMFRPIDLSLGQGAAWIIINLAMFRPIDLSLGQGAAWIPDDANILKFKALNLPNPVCKVNTDCDPVKGVVIGIVDAKYKGNSIISQDCSCIEQSSLEHKEVCSCKVTFNLNLGPPGVFRPTSKKSLLVQMASRPNIRKAKCETASWPTVRNLIVKSQYSKLV
uniref:Uncharacterized protein n=1 Tax=Cacopsylla melanoneura TaxID=428564 RepID=A0A8D9E2Z9_9HEMI